MKTDLFNNKLGPVWTRNPETNVQLFWCSKHHDIIVTLLCPHCCIVLWIFNLHYQNPWMNIPLWRLLYDDFYNWMNNIVPTCKERCNRRQNLSAELYPGSAPKWKVSGIPLKSKNGTNYLLVTKIVLISQNNSQMTDLRYFQIPWTLQQQRCHITMPKD